ncbi:MFS transporter [Enterobacter sp. Ap-916]|uniref:MFS transporter n=1 Tax=Enterobacteriaceae TaxID=543 RepID=UPI0014210557|nr:MULTISPECIES: MFS transporter [Enterobacteriaceae]NIF46668.1 MFS transporter [Enterobacter sp. Ap-1006]NIF57216.1 MFS transporter [Enterobacter sp. Ap-867]NIG28843.1 MFS transporter [Enterobacter sp. Ap-916]
MSSLNEQTLEQGAETVSLSRAGLLKALFALGMGGFAIGTGEFVIMGLLPDAANGLHVSIPSAGHLISIYALGVVVGAPLLAVLGARMARRDFLIALMAMFAVGNLLSAFAPGYYSMMLARFLAGFPHGTFFGVAALLAASLVERSKRAQAVSMVLLGLTIANLLGVPAVAAIGQLFGWRSAFAIVGGLAVLTLILVWIWVPWHAGDKDASPLRELTALTRKQVLLTLAIGAIGSGGMFSVFSYVKPTMLELAHQSVGMIPVILSMFGLGMIVGNIVGGRLADRGLEKTVRLLLIWAILVLSAYVYTSHYPWLGAVTVMLVGTMVSLSSVLQIRLMDVAGDAQTMAAAMNHSAFNIANALGAWLGGVTISAGFGWESTGWVGAILAVFGLLIHTWAVIDAKKHPPLAH